MLHQTEIQFKRSHSSNHVPIIFASFCKLLCLTFLSPSSEVSAWIHHVSSCCCSHAAYPPLFSIMFFDLFFAELLWCCCLRRWRGLCYWESRRRHVNPRTLLHILGVWDKWDFLLLVGHLGSGSWLFQKRTFTLPSLTQLGRSILGRGGCSWISGQGTGQLFCHLSRIEET